MGTGILVPIEDDRPAEITPIPLGQAGFAYAKDELSHGGPLAVRTLEAFKGKGQVFAPLEKGTLLLEAEEFKNGKDSPTVAIRSWIADYITLHWGKDCQLIVEDPWMKPSDRIRHLKTEYFIINNTIYYTPYEATVEQSFILGANQTRSWGFAIFVIDPPVHPIATKKDIAPHMVEQLVENVKAVIISAYDHDGYVIWEI